jgi:hypothetical protein
MAFQARVFVDTATLRHSIRSRTRLVPQKQTTVWGGKVLEFDVYELNTLDPTAKVTEEPLRTEIDLLSRVAMLAKSGEIELLWQVETQLEFLGQYKMPGGGRSELAEAGLTLVSGPIEYSRMITPPLGMPGQTWRSMQLGFLRSLQHPRFLELQRICGANEGAQKRRDSQLKDAFHIWSAEVANATHFLTTDFKLVHRVRDFKALSTVVKVVAPSDLMADLPAPAN